MQPLKVMLKGLEVGVELRESGLHLHRVNRKREKGRESERKMSVGCDEALRRKQPQREIRRALKHKQAKHTHEKAKGIFMTKEKKMRSLIPPVSSDLLLYGPGMGET